MLRRELLGVWMATPLIAWLRAWLPAMAGDGAVEEANAATVYRKVFGWSKGLPAGDKERLRKAATIAIDDPGIDALLREGGHVLGALREAASIPLCQWETEVLSTDDLTRDRLDIFNVDAIRLACLSARRHARAGRGRDALDDVFAGLTFAHRIGTGGVMFARILECGGEVPAFQTLGRILPGLDRATLDDLSRRLDVLPSPEPAGATVGPESRFILATLRKRIEAAGPVIAGQKWGEIGFDDEEGAAIGRLTGGDRAKLLAHLEANDRAFAELARRLDLPRPGCLGALDAFARDERSTHPIVAGLVENIRGVRHMVDRMHALRSMLRAGLAMVRDGDAAFQAQSDPFGSGPFDLERRGKGFLIRSALRDAGKPEVSLAIGDVG